MANALIAHHRVPTLVLCDRQELIDQWRGHLTTHLGLTIEQIGQVGAGRKRLSGVVDIATIQSLARRDEPWEAFVGYGFVIVDECHHLPAVSFEATVRRAAVPRWLGMTATPYRRDGVEAILAMQCGPVRHEISLKSTAAALLRLDLIVHETLSDPVPVENPAIQDVLRGIAEDEERNAMVCADVLAALAKRRNCVVLTQRTDQIDRFVRRLAAGGVSPLVLRGGLGKKARAAVRDALSQDDDGGTVLVATASYLGEGFDWPALDTLFLAFPLAWKGRVVQYVGRLLRAHEGKDQLQVHDYVDGSCPCPCSLACTRSGWPVTPASASTSAQRASGLVDDPAGFCGELLRPLRSGWPKITRTPPSTTGVTHQPGNRRSAGCQVMAADCKDTKPPSTYIQER